MITDVNDAKAIQEKLGSVEDRLLQAEGAISDRNPSAAMFFIEKALETIRSEQEKLNEE